MNRHTGFRSGLDARNLLVIIIGLVLLAFAWDYAGVLLAIALIAVAVNVIRFALARQRARR
jgi:Flp pilus assembly protein TadB